MHSMTIWLNQFEGRNANAIRFKTGDIVEVLEGSLPRTLFLYVTIWRKYMPIISATAFLSFKAGWPKQI